MENPLLLRVVTLCDVDHRISDITASPVDFVFCLGDLEDVWMANRVEALNPRYGAYGIRGNHDVNAPFPSNIEDLNFMNKAVVVDGRRVRLAGVPGSWRYKPYGRWLFYQDEVSEMTDAMEAADILISHNCPANIGHELRTHFLFTRDFWASTIILVRRNLNFYFMGTSISTRQLKSRRLLSLDVTAKHYTKYLCDERSLGVANGRRATSARKSFDRSSG